MHEEELERKRIEEEKLERERIKREEIERERLEKERLEILKMENKLYPNNSLFIIPSWSDLIGYPTLGTYVHHPVSNIESDTVIFLSGYDYSIETTKGTLHYLFGLGYYFLKFELESGKYVTDNRILTGLILSDFVYDHMATSENITLEEDRDVIIAEKVIKIPIDLSYKSENHLTFIKGALMRNVFIPKKDILLEMMETIRKDDTYQISNEGHKLLSSHWDGYNQILVSDKIRANPDTSYLNTTAGLDGITIAADEILQGTISQINLSIIEDMINTLKDIYSNLEFDPMYLYSILEKALPMLRSESPPISSKQRDSTTSKGSKESIFVSAEDRLFEFITWPNQFKRKVKKEPIKLPQQLEQPLYQDLKVLPISDVKPPTITESKQEPFEIDTQKSVKAEITSLPPPPKPDINEILLYLKKILEENYEMRLIGQAFEISRESARKLGVSSTALHQKKVWEMSKYANIYIKKEPGLGLPIKEKEELLRKINEWVFEIEESARLERERLERARLEKERLEKLERERKKRDKEEKERQEAQRLERLRIEKKRLDEEQLKKERLEKIEKATQEVLRIEKERLQKEREEQEALEKEKQEVERLKQERKQKEKAAKQEAKKRKKLDKQKKKIEKKKLKEQEKLNNL